jgi:sugar transferase (PEP-CTERM/EpsH1 system associated)
MRILFVSPYIPSPVRVRPYHWIRALARQGHRVRLVALQPPEDRWIGEAPVRDCCEHVTVFQISRLQTLGNAMRALPRDLPLQAAYSLHPEAERFIAAEASRGCDVVHVEHLRGSLLARRVKDVPCVIDAVDSITALFEQTVRHAPSWQQRAIARLDLARTRRFEAGVPGRFARSIVTSTRDAAAFQELSGSSFADRVVAVPNGVDLDYFQPAAARSQPDTIVFTGKMSYHANDAAALRLGREIMPRIWRERPSARLVIAGKDPSPAVQALGHDRRVTVTGFVNDMRPFLWSAAIAAAPLIYGTGIQNKVLEAMACGIPVVASSTACEGLGAVAQRDLLVGTDDDALAAHALTLLRNESLRASLAKAGRRYVATHHHWDEMAKRLVGVYADAQAVYRRCA